MTVRDIVKVYLAAHGYDGLWNEDGECACLADDLAPCDGECLNCRPGYRVPCNPETCELGGDCRFHIAPHKPGASDSDRDKKELK